MKGNNTNHLQYIIVPALVLGMLLGVSQLFSGSSVHASDSGSEQLPLMSVKQAPYYGENMVRFQTRDGDLKFFTKTELEQELSSQHPDFCPCKIKFKETKNFGTFANPVPVEEEPKKTPEPEGVGPEEENPKTKEKLQQIVKQLFDGDRRVVKLANLDKELREKFKEIIDRPLGEVNSLEILGKKGIPVVDHKKAAMAKGKKELAGGNWHHGRTNARKKNSKGEETDFNASGNESEGTSTADVIAFGGGDTLRVPMDEIDWDQLDMDPDELK